MSINIDLLDFSSSIKKKFLNLINTNLNLRYLLLERNAFEKGEAKSIAQELKLDLSIFNQ